MDQVEEIIRSDIRYSRLLSQITDPPETLYCRGNISLLKSTCIAVVGTRKITPYGRETAAVIARDLAFQGFTIVSGLAMGVDAAAHAAALDAHGATIAVLGSGIDLITPITNQLLGERILREGGLIIS